jgi:alpha-glucosidase
MAYCFDLLGDCAQRPFLHGVFARFSSVVGDGWPCWALSNHDCVRVWPPAGAQQNPPAGPAAPGGSPANEPARHPCLYQGEELGLPEADMAYEDLQDPYGITMWPEFKGRDGCRTPMPWSASAPQAGFSSATRTWLPVAQSHLALAVDQQQAQPQSMLHFMTQLLHWRRQQGALLHGAMRLLPEHAQVIAFEREADGQQLLCAFNFSDTPAIFPLPAEWTGTLPRDGSGLAGAQMVGSSLHFEPWGGLFLQQA